MWPAKARRRRTSAATEPPDLTAGRALAALAAGSARSALAAVVLAHVRQPVGAVAAAAAGGAVAVIGGVAVRVRAGGNPGVGGVGAGDACGLGRPEAVW